MPIASIIARQSPVVGPVFSTVDKLRRILPDIELSAMEDEPRLAHIKFRFAEIMEIIEKEQG